MSACTGRVFMKYLMAKVRLSYKYLFEQVHPIHISTRYIYYLDTNY